MQDAKSDLSTSRSSRIKMYQEVGQRRLPERHLMKPLWLDGKRVATVGP